jgi:hypothetical protein
MVTNFLYYHLECDVFAKAASIKTTEIIPCTEVLLKSCKSLHAFTRNGGVDGVRGPVRFSFLPYCLLPFSYAIYTILYSSLPSSLSPMHAEHLTYHCHNHYIVYMSKFEVSFCVYHNSFSPSSSSAVRYLLKTEVLNSSLSSRYRRNFQFVSPYWELKNS